MVSVEVKFDRINAIYKPGVSIQNYTIPLIFILGNSKWAHNYLKPQKADFFGSCCG